MVATEDGLIVGHVAISPVTITSGETGWYGLGPISVCPNKQGIGIGSLLMNAALQKLKDLGGKGCVLLGDPNYYSRFGFKSYPDLIYLMYQMNFQAISSAIIFLQEKLLIMKHLWQLNNKFCLQHIIKSLYL